jgi:DNA-binding NtrC family response regulator
MKKTVLLIDDERDFGLLLKGFFARKHYDVCVSYTIEEGMKALEEIKPDFIFLDNNLPDGLGWGKIEYIVKNYPKSQLNLISAYHTPKTTPNTIRVLEKPISIDDLDKLFKQHEQSV